MIRLYRFPYSCYALKVQYLLDALELAYQTVDVPYSDRTELVELTSGRVVVPAIDHDGHIVVESRTICEYLLGLKANALVPKGRAAMIWSYADWCDSTLEDVLFRIASPGIAEKFSTSFEKALFIFIKERKFGSGCVEEWRQAQLNLIEKAREVLQKTMESIAVNKYVAGEALTFADINLLGHLAMVDYADPGLVSEISPRLPEYMERVRSRD